jgi:hypothetical protein
MTTTSSPAIFRDAPPIPTENPFGDVELQRSEDREEALEAHTDLLAVLIARVRKLLPHARSNRARV